MSEEDDYADPLTWQPTDRQILIARVLFMVFIASAAFATAIIFSN
jgi:hypothetical protein